MSKKLDDYKKSTIQFFGFKFQKRQFFIVSGIILGTLLLMVALTLIGLNISWYGIMIGLGFVMALIVCIQLCDIYGIDREYPYTLLWWIFPFSIVGARLYFCIFHGISDFGQIVRVWEGGLAIYGGVISGLIGLIICCLIHKKDIVKTTDIVAPVLALGQMFGRIGCLFGECCYGVQVTNKSLQWFPIAIFVNGDYHYATNFYECILDLGIFITLVILLRKVKLKGLVTLAYLFGYGLIRFILEFFRDKDQTLFIGDYPVSQLLSIILVIGSVVGICILLLVNNSKNAKKIAHD